jgi:DNA protecting protein DprA
VIDDAVARDVGVTRSLPMFGDADDATMVDQPSRRRPDHPEDSKSPAIRAEDFARSLIALGRVHGLGVQGIRALLQHYGRLQHVWTGDVTATRDVLARARVREAGDVAVSIHRDYRRRLDDAEQQRRQFMNRGIRIVSDDDEEFPQSLREVPDGPAWLFVEGDVSTLTGASLIAVVGTRDASPAGRTAASRLAETLVIEGLGVVSGLAEGIDQAAHAGAALHGGRQVAVLGTGIDITFPPSMTGMRHMILATRGAVITEYLPGDRFGRAKFVQRNRIQAALAAAVCPVEGMAQGGTAHTVRFARQYRRKLFGVVAGGSSPNNELLSVLQQEGDRIYDLSLVDDAQDLVTMLRALPGGRWTTEPGINSKALFADTFAQLDEVHRAVGITPTLGMEFIREFSRRYGIPLRPKEPGDGR